MRRPPLVPDPRDAETDEIRPLGSTPYASTLHMPFDRETREIDLRSVPETPSLGSLLLRVGEISVESSSSSRPFLHPILSIDRDRDRDRDREHSPTPTALSPSPFSPSSSRSTSSSLADEESDSAEREIPRTGNGMANVLPDSVLSVRTDEAGSSVSTGTTGTTTMTTTSLAASEERESGKVMRSQMVWGLAEMSHGPWNPETELDGRTRGKSRGSSVVEESMWNPSTRGPLFATEASSSSETPALFSSSRDVSHFPHIESSLPPLSPSVDRMTRGDGSEARDPGGHIGSSFSSGISSMFSFGSHLEVSAYGRSGIHEHVDEQTLQLVPSRNDVLQRFELANLEGLEHRILPPPTSSGLGEEAQAGKQWQPRGALRFVYLLVASVHILFTSGVVFGFASLQGVLSKEGLYREMCSKDDEFCESRQLQFGIIFTVGSIANYLSNLPFGYLLDRYGPKTTCIVACSVFLLGCFLCIAGTSLGFDGYLLGFCLFGLSGPGVQLPTFHLSNLFVLQGSVLSLFTALFDGSTVVFLLIEILYESGGVSLSSLFTGYAAIIIFILVSGAWLWPSYNFRSEVQMNDVRIQAIELVELPSENRNGQNDACEKVSDPEPSWSTLEFNQSENFSDNDRLLESSSVSDGKCNSGPIEIPELRYSSVTVSYSDASKDTPLRAPVESDRFADVGTVSAMESSSGSESTTLKGITLELYDAAFVRQIRSFKFLYVALFASIHVLRLNFVVLSIHDQLKSSFSSSEASSLITIFSSLLPIGFIAMPLVGYFVDKRGYPDTFHMVNVSGILWGIGLLFPSYWLQIMSYLIFSTNRQFVFSTFFAYSAQSFGYKNWGKISGLNNVIVALCSALQYFLAYVAMSLMNGNFFFVNLISIGLVIFLFFPPRSRAHYQRVE